MAQVDDHDNIMDFIHNTPKGTALGLYSIGSILKNMGNPEKKLKIIHVGGTNGKGSTCTFIAEMLQGMGYKVGLYTSPFLEEFNERIRINKKNISNEDLVKVFSLTKNAVDRYLAEGDPMPTEFEITTASAYQYFLQENVDWVVLEVGLGGALDATNTCDPILSVITSISIDHVEYLGDDLLEIARTKAGIIKKGKPCVLYSQSEDVENVIINYAEEMGSEIFITEPEKVIMRSADRYGQTFDLEVLGESFHDIRISMAGEHQVKNFVTALTAVKILERKKAIKILEESVLKKAAIEAKWKGRTELIVREPITILDGAHNVDGAAVLSKYIRSHLADRKILLVFGMLKDKDINGTLAHLAPLADRFVITIPDSPRAASANEVQMIVEKYKKDSNIRICEKIEEAVRYAQSIGEAEEGVAIIYAGSLYMIGAARTALRKRYHLDH
ncbi:MAG: folylpolyglutamate synthase/dihydrofolate synthase family protein [Peptostreptococcaceae bacterium]|nr:folylpolyglutamate synthase/dihydrofolate synthase family protein [Peptostreptococcaceae bacterium]